MIISNSTGPVSFSATHRVLLVSELAERIAHSTMDGDRRPWEKTCLSLGLTCHALYDPAMNALWYKLVDYRNLLVCFPLDVLQENAQPDKPWVCRSCDTFL